MKLLKGAFTAIITPMKENGDVDYEGFRRLVNFQLEQGIDGLVPLGTTGEGPTLSEGEKEKLIRIAVEEAKGKVPLIIVTGSNDTKQTINNTKQAKELGGDFAMVVTP
jgi:4-hydroxy-tetrahydrodipicolinate synthase